MGLSITAKNTSRLADGIWEVEMPPHQVRFFGDCRRSEGTRSVILLSGASYDAASRSLVFDADDVIPLNVGNSNMALVIDATATAPAPKKAVPEGSFGAGDREFLSLTRELPAEGREAAAALLRLIRERSPGDLRRGLQRNFSNTPDNFWYAIVQPRIGGLSITVRGEPSRFAESKLELKPDRPGYTRFKLATMADVPEALRLIFASKRN